MSSLSTLPPANEAALVHTQNASQAIYEAIKSANGWITFEQYMNMALYAPGLGYYSGGSIKFGGTGDFVTAPEISSLFGRTLARQVEQISTQIPEASILEFGAGSGKLALDLLLALENLDALPEKYYILEVSAELRLRQQVLIANQAAHLLHLVEWLDQLPEAFSGVVLANEVLDAMPVHVVEWQDNALFERGVSWQQEQFEWQSRPIENESLETVANALTTHINPNNDAELHYISEINMAARYFVRSIADCLQQGAVILIDYGFGREEYYHPQRSQGTLMCHYRHHAHDNPFYHPGLQDITSHVDFSAILEAVENTGLTLMGYTNQAHFLINCGITDLLTETPVDDSDQYLPQANQLQKLVSPAEMGELFKVIALGKNITQPLIGFSNGDLSRLL